MLGSCQRKKSIKPHVRTACINCKKAHLACDAERPCKRCISVGKTDSCYDIQHKKRGRPKLREKYASSLMKNGNNTTTLTSPLSSLYTSSSVAKKQVSRLHTHSSSHFQPMLPLTLPSSLPQSPSPSSSITPPHHQLISSPPSMDSLTPFLAMSPPPSSFIMTKSTTIKPEYDLAETLNESMMTIFLTTEMCCARASDETMDFIGYHPQELAHRSLYDFISNPTDLQQIHHHLTQSHHQALLNNNNAIGGMSPPHTSTTSSNNSNNDYYHQMPPTTLLNIANGSKTFKMVLHFRTIDGKERVILNARLYFGGGLGADLCQPSTLDHLYIVCLLTKPTPSSSSSTSFTPGLALSSNPTTTTTTNNITPSIAPPPPPPVSPLSLKSPSHPTDTNIFPDMSVPSPISPSMNSSSILSTNDSTTTAIQNVMTDFSSLSYLSSSLSSVSSSSSTNSSYIPTTSSSSIQLPSIPITSSSLPPSCSSLMLTPPYSSNQTPSALDHEESSLYSWLDFAFSSNGTIPK